MSGKNSRRNTKKLKMQPDALNETHNNISQESAQKLIDLHIAEYQALTNRCTYWISLQFAAVSILLIYLGIVATVWNSLDHAYLIWGSVFVVQIVVIVWLQLLSEQFRAISYVEHNLRNLVEPLVGSKSFWGYEKYLDETRGTGLEWWEYSVGNGNTNHCYNTGLFAFPTFVIRVS